MKWMQRLLLIGLVLSLSVGTLMPFGATMASKVSDLREQQKKLNQKKNEIDSQIGDKKEEINQIESDKDAVNRQIESLDDSIGEASEKIRKTELAIEDLEGKIAKLNSEIADLKKRIEARNQLIKDRALAYQESGGEMSFIEVLLGARSFADLLERADALSVIISADNEILEKQEKEKAEVELTTKQVEKNRAKMVSERNRLETIQKELNAQKKKKNELLASLDLKEEQIEDAVLDLKEQDELLTKQKADVDRMIAAELAKGGGNGSSGFKPGKGVFSNPCSGRLTSGYGYRKSTGSFHHGIDIAQGGTNPIWAAADGVVTRAYYSSSYGYCVFMTHMIGGQIYTTVYAHMRHKPLVSEGQTITRGTQLGIMGNTGRSYGQHLHFEIYKGSWTSGHGNSVNPLDYVNY